MQDGLGGELLRRLRDRGPQAKATLADSVGQPRTTVSAVVRDLQAAGLVEDGPASPSTGGRRAVTVRIAADQVFVAVSLGERRLRVGTLNGHLVVTGGTSTDLTELVDQPDAATTVPDRVVEELDVVLAGRVPSAVVVAAADPEGEPALGTLARLREHEDGVPVTLVPSTRAMAIGERLAGTFDDDGDSGDFVTVRLGRTVSAAMSVDGRLVGGDGGRASGIGHLRVDDFGPMCGCGRSGCLDAYAGSAAVVEQADSYGRRGRSPAFAAALEAHGRLTLGDVVAAVEARDPVACQLARDVGQRVGQVLAGVVALSGARGIVLGGPVAALGRDLLEAVRASVHRSAPPTATHDLRIVLSTVGERAVLVGCGWSAVEEWSHRVGGPAPDHPTSDEMDQKSTRDGQNDQFSGLE